MRNFSRIILLLSLLSSCINADDLQYMFPKHYLDGNSAKIWVLEKSSLENDSALTHTEAYRKSFIFHDNRTFREQEFIHLGSQQGEYGRFWVFQDKGDEVFLRLNYENKKEVLFFDVLHINKHTLTLKNQKTSVIWEFKSLTPPL